VCGERNILIPAAAAILLPHSHTRAHSRTHIYDDDEDDEQDRLYESITKGTRGRWQESTDDADTEDDEQEQLQQLYHRRHQQHNLHQQQHHYQHQNHDQHRTPGAATRNANRVKRKKSARRNIKYVVKPVRRAPSAATRRPSVTAKSNSAGTPISRFFLCYFRPS